MISVILPTYNESENIISLIVSIHKLLEGYNHEIVVVDDNSTDNTYNICVEYDKPYLKTILRTNNKGLAYSIRCGIENTNGSIIIVMDSDFNHNPKHIPFMIAALKYYDLIAASRYEFGGGMYGNNRYYLSYFFNLFIRLFTWSRLTDHLSGYYAVRKEVLVRMNHDKIFYGYGDYYIRLLNIFQKNKLKILQFPVFYDMRRGGQSKTRFLKTFYIYFFSTLKITFSNK